MPTASRRTVLQRALTVIVVTALTAVALAALLAPRDAEAATRRFPTIEQLQRQRLLTAYARTTPKWRSPRSPQSSPNPSPSPSPSETTPETDPVTSPTGIRLEVGTDLQATVDRHPAGTTFVLAPGVHRAQWVRPRDGDTFVGESGAVMNGARVLDPAAFTRSGSLWVVGGQTQEGPYYPDNPDDRMQPGHFAEERPEELFADGQRLRKVDALSQVTRPGTWFFDYTGDRIYLYDDPRTFGLLETSVTTYAFQSAASNVTVENVTVTRYANPSQRGAVDGNDGIGWVIRHVTATQNHAVGIRGSRAGTIANSRVTHNGQMGMIADGRVHEGEGKYAPMLVESNEIAYNLELGYDAGWEGGGTKFVRTDRGVFRNNWIHHNRGYGFWFDIDNKGALIESNLSEQNELLGIFYEISKAAVIRWNISRDNGQGMTSRNIGDDGAAMFIANSSDVEVYGNALYGRYGWPFLARHRSERYSDPISWYGQNEVARVVVHHNDMRLTSSFVGIKSDTTATWTSKGNRFYGNTYRTNGGSHYAWNGNDLGDRAAWQAAGNDTDGRWLADSADPTVAADGVPFRPATYGAR